MKLQVAFDLGSFKDLNLFLEKVEDLIDIVEIGTPFNREGGCQRN